MRPLSNRPLLKYRPHFKSKLPVAPGGYVQWKCDLQEERDVAFVRVSNRRHRSVLRYCCCCPIAWAPGQPRAGQHLGRREGGQTCGRDALTGGGGGGVVAFKNPKRLEGGSGSAPTPAGPDLGKHAGQGAAAAVHSCLSFPTCSTSKARALRQPRRANPPQVVGASRAVGTASRWLPATATLLPSVSGSSPAEACRRQAMDFSGRRWPYPGRPPCHRAGQGEPRAGRGDTGGTAGCGTYRVMPTPGGNPPAQRARWFVQRRARELRLKKAPLRSERLARTVPYCGAVTLPFTLLLLSNTLLFHFLLSPIHSPGFSLPSRPCCFRFFCLKFLRGRFYFQRFD